MLTLLFYLGDSAYAITCERIREIVPMMALKRAPHAPEWFGGFFNYRGDIVPVIDLRRLIQGHPCELRLSTRIILVDYYGRRKTPSLLGLIAERVTETVRRLETAAASPPIRFKETPYLGAVMIEDKTLIQRIDLDCLPDCMGLPETEGEPNAV